MAVTDNNYLEFKSNSKSGQFFFYTHNKQFMIKTMSEQEFKFLRSILKDYYNVRIICFMIISKSCSDMVLVINCLLYV